MRRPGLLVFGWAVVTALSTIAAWRAVSFVASNVTPRASIPVAAGDLETQPAGADTAPPPDSTSAPPPGSPAQDGPAAAPSPAPAAGGPTPSSIGAPRVPPSTTAPPPPPASAPTSPATEAETAAAPPPATAPVPAAETRTVPAVGGAAAFEFAAGTVELLWARPEPGFTVTVLRREADRVELEFRSDTHTSRIRARWIDGPVTDVNESGG